MIRSRKMMIRMVPVILSAVMLGSGVAAQILKQGTPVPGIDPITPATDPNPVSYPLHRDSFDRDRKGAAEGTKKSTDPKKSGTKEPVEKKTPEKKAAVEKKEPEEKKTPEKKAAVEKKEPVEKKTPEKKEVVKKEPPPEKKVEEKKESAGKSEEVRKTTPAGAKKDVAIKINEDEKPSSKDTAEKKEQDPDITLIRVKPHPQRKYSAIITWQVSSKNKDPIYVGRYRKPLSNQDLVLEADNLTSPPLGAQETRFTDLNIPQGTYYYVVVTRSEMKGGGKNLVLKPNENYTITPIIVKRRKGPALAKEKKEENLPDIRALTVRAHPKYRNAAIISWNLDGPESDVFIGRRSHPIKLPDQALGTDKLTEKPLQPWQRYFIDWNVPAGDYYYVVYTRKETEKELILKPGENLNPKPFQVPPGLKMVEHDKPKEKVVIKYIEKKEPDHKKEAEVKKGEPERRKEEAERPKRVEPIGRYEVSGLLAVNAAKSVKLNWKPARADNIFYSIYRSPTPLSDEIGYDKAILLANVPEGQYSLEDTAPLSGQKVFYGVTVSEKDTTREYRRLRFKSSYIQHEFQTKHLAKNVVDYIPDSLTWYHKEARSVELYWSKPMKTVYGYRIYRFSSPIHSEAKLREAEFLDRVDPNETSFTIRDLSPGRYFFALMPLDRHGREIRSFVEGRTFTGFAVTIRGDRKEEKGIAEKEKKEPVRKETVKKETPKGIPVLEDFRARIVKRDVKLSWEADLKGRDDVFFRIYRSGVPMRNLQDVKREGIIVNVLSARTRYYEDSNLSEGKYYYALLMEVGGRLQELMIEGRNFLKRPLAVKGGQRPTQVAVKKEPDVKEKKEPIVREKRDEPIEEKIEKPDRKEKREPDHADIKTEDELLRSVDRIIRLTYKRNRYERAVRRLAPYVRDSAIPSAVKARAMFYTGLSYYKIGRYRSAVDCFLNGHVRSEYPKRSRFWYRRAIERIR